MKPWITILLAGALLGRQLKTTADPEKQYVFAQHQKLALAFATTPPDRAPVYKLFEVTLNLHARYNNPFDPAQVDVHADFNSPQSGKPIRVNGFLFQDYKSELISGRERLTPVGQPQWRIRFAADAPGVWRYTISATDQSGSKTLPVRRFTAAPGPDPGFVGRSKRNPAVWAFKGEKPFFAVGENMCWAGDRGAYDFANWLPALHAAGGNWIRIWMNNANTTLEWSAPNNASQTRDFGFHGLGQYSLDHAWKLDTILDYVEKNDIYAMICFGTYGEFTTGGFFGEGQWPLNPYNAANGGPCEQPGDFWTNPEARKLYRQRVRYILARYGYRTHIHSWEFWNEANPPAAWVAEMARYVKGVGEFAKSHPDPFNHLVTTTYGSDAIWRIPELDFTQTHSYGTGNIPDFAPVAHSDAQVNAAFGKPHIMGEFGIDWRAPDDKYDPKGLGVNLHNTLWAAMMSGDAGTAMTWWWDNYIAPKNVYKPFRAVRDFADTVNWTAGPWSELVVDPPRSSDLNETFSDLTIHAGGAWGKSAADFTVNPKGLASGAALPSYLYAPSKPELRTVPQFHVDYRKAGKFSLLIGAVSATSDINILVDGQPVRTIHLDAAPPAAGSTAKPEYEQTKYMPEYRVYQAVFNKEYTVNIPKGAHTISLDNTAGDWAEIVSITLGSYRSSVYSDLNVFGLKHDRDGILWVQNAAHNWRNVFDGKTIETVSRSSTAVRGLPDGLYDIAWWNTESGVVFKHQQVRSAGGAILMDIPEVSTDIAARFTPHGAASSASGKTVSKPDRSPFREERTSLLSK